MNEKENLTGEDCCHYDYGRCGLHQKSVEPEHMRCGMFTPMPDDIETCGEYTDPPRPDTSELPRYEPKTGLWDNPLIENAQPFCNGCKSRRDVGSNVILRKGERAFVHCYCANLGMHIVGHPDPEECGFEPDGPTIEERIRSIEMTVEKILDHLDDRTRLD